jgi:hypothetical protein
LAPAGERARVPPKGRHGVVDLWWEHDPGAGNAHVLLLGATWAGKSRRVILPTVWCLGHRGEWMVLTDPKGELHAACAGWLRAHGYGVVLIDLPRPGRGQRWNPLAAMRRAHEAGDAEEASRLARDLGNTLAFADQGAGTDPRPALRWSGCGPGVRLPGANGRERCSPGVVS